MRMTLTRYASTRPNAIYQTGADDHQTWEVDHHGGAGDPQIGADGAEGQQGGADWLVNHGRDRDLGRAETDNTGSAFTVSRTVAVNTKKSSIDSLTQTGQNDTSKTGLLTETWFRLDMMKVHKQDHRLGLVRQTVQLTCLGKQNKHPVHE